jgi:DNA-binding response OmpR family regulator
VVEDETVVALEIAQILRKGGFEVVGPARSANRALQLIDDIGCDAAVLDINLGRETSERVAIRLRERNTPFVTVSGYSRGQHPAVFASAPALTKPLRSAFLFAALKECMIGVSGTGLS